MLVPCYRCYRCMPHYEVGVCGCPPDPGTRDSASWVACAAFLQRPLCSSDETAPTATGGPIKCQLLNFEEQAREQGGIFMRDATNRRGGTSDMDAQKEEGEV